VVRQSLATPQALLGAIGDSLMVKNRNRYDQGLAPDGTPWKPLAPSTIGNEVWKKQDKDFRKGNSERGPMHSLKVAREVQAKRRVLFASGEMLTNSLHPDVQGDTLRMGFDIDRAKWHHFGTKPYTITPKKAKALSFGGVAVKRVHHPGLPARPLLGFPAEDAQAVVDEVKDYLLNALRGARGR
jgi:phage gpG-like protein